MKTEFLASPLNYLGGKYKLLPQLLPHFPFCNYLVDAFAGGCNVGVNASAKHIICNDTNAHLMELMRYFQHTDTEQILKQLYDLIEYYQLSNTEQYGYDHYQADSQTGLAQYNKTAYLNLRHDYNQQPTPIRLYALIVFGFNNQIRFNQQGAFNLPVGKRDFNRKMREKLVQFSGSLKHKNITFQQQDFRDLLSQKLPENTLVYCDPPYILTTATYNERNAWTVQDEHDLLNLLNELHHRKIKFALSNVLSAKNQQHEILQIWLAKYGYTCHYLNQSYANSNYQRKHKDSKSVEVLITNF